MNKPDLVIFDCDGVLVDSETIANRIMARSLTAHGLKTTTEECKRLFIGGKLSDVKVKAQNMGAKLPEDWVEQIYAVVYARLREGCALIDGVTTVLDKLDAHNIPYCVASNGSREKMGITLGQNGILERFQGRVYSAHELNTSKPAPELFLHAARGFNLDHCVVIEDSLNGIRAAHAAGIRCFGYTPEGGAVETATPFGDMHALPALLGLG